MSHPTPPLPAVAQLRLVVEAGAKLIAPPIETPWRSLNSRLAAPAGLQITLFQQLDRPPKSG